MEGANECAICRRDMPRVSARFGAVYLRLYRFTSKSKSKITRARVAHEA